MSRVPRLLLLAFALYGTLRLPIEAMTVGALGTVERGPGLLGMPPLEGPAVLQPFLRWDSGWYVRIIRDGYSYADCRSPDVPCAQASIAFLPVYPMAVRALTTIGFTLPLGSFIITHLGLLAAIWGLLQLGSMKFGDEDSGIRAAAAMLVYPASIFLSAGYAEVVFLGLGIWALVFFERGDDFSCAALLAIGAITRSQGMLLVGAVGLAALLSRRWKTAVIVGVASGLVIGAYVFWQYRTYGDALAFMHARRGWGFTAPPLPTFLEYWERTKRGNLAMEGWLDFFCIPLVAVTAVLAWKQLGPVYSIYCALIVIVPMSSGQAWAFSRISLCAFPVFLLTAKWTKNRWAQFAVLAIGLGWLGMSGVRLANGLFIGT
ncbi:MAG: mannosyltransferase family protein [Archangium sp.]